MLVAPKPVEGGQAGGSNSSAPISTVVDPAIGRVSPSISTVIGTELSPPSLINDPVTCKSVVDIN